MTGKSNLQSLPAEVTLAIFYSIDDLQTIFALARASSSLYDTWKTYLVDIYRNLLQRHSYQGHGSQSIMKFHAHVSSPELKVGAAKDLVKLHRLARMVCKEPVRPLPILSQAPNRLPRDPPLNYRSQPLEQSKVTREVQMRFQRAMCNLCTMATLSPGERLAFVNKFKPAADGLNAIYGLWMLLSGEQGDGDSYFKWSKFMILDMWHRSNSVFKASPFSKMGEGSSCIHYAGFKDIKPQYLCQCYHVATLTFLLLEEKACRID